MNPLFLIVLAAILLTGLVAGLAWKPMRRESQLERRMVRLHELHPPQRVAERSQGGFLTKIAASIGGLFTRSGLLSAKAITSLETTLAAAGLRGGQALPIFVGAKASLLALCSIAGITLVRELDLTGTLAWAAPAGGAIIGLLAPDFILRVARARYLAAVETAMPDALDLLVICSEAGLALEQGIDRVSREIRISSPACATELALTSDELRIMADRSAALRNMAKRTGLVSVERLAGTLVQALHYGTPLSQALRTLSSELRGDALTRFEARAARLPVLLTLPMILFILPCIFLIVIGPAALSIIDAMTH